MKTRKDGNFHSSIIIHAIAALAFTSISLHAATQPSPSALTELAWFEPLDDKTSGSWIARNPRVFAQLGGSSIQIQPRLQVGDTPASPVQIIFSNASTETTLVSSESRQSKSHYIPNSNPQHWRHVTQHARLRAEQFYPGIDLEYYFQGSSLEFDFIVKPGGRPENIQLTFAPNQTPKLNDQGELLIHDSRGHLIYTLQPPYAYQNIANENRTVNSHFQLEQNSVKIITANYDETHTLIIDPVVTLSTYLGGSANEYGYGIGTDAQNNLYITGLTDSTDFPLQSPWQSGFSGYNSLFIAKLIPGTPATLDYATFVGTDIAEIRDIVVDSNGQAIVTGSTSSLTYPLFNPLQATHGGLIDTYITKLSADGSSLVFSTYFGGISVDRGRGITLDNQENIIVTGPTSSTNLPLLNAAQTTLQGGIDAYVAKISADGQNLLFSTFLGGNAFDYSKDVSVDSVNNIHVAAYTYSTDLVTLNPIQNSNAGGTDFMLASYSATGQLQQLSYYGGAGDDFAHGIINNAQGDIVVAGYTHSADFPLSADTPQAFAGIADGVLLTFTPGAGVIKTSHLYGGSGFDYFERIDRNAGRIAVTGTSQSTDWPVLNPVQPNLLGFSDAVILEFLDDNSLNFSTYFGGEGSDVGYDVSISVDGSIHITGSTNSSFLPTTNALQLQLAGQRDAIIVSFARDTDGDLIADNVDNCINIYNPDQADTNNNGTGDICELPVITGIWPASGTTGQSMSAFIFGDNFLTGNTPEVYFNGIRQYIVQAVSDEMLIARITVDPSLTGPVSVITPLGTAISNTSFGVPLAGLQLTGVWPGQANDGEVVSVFLFGNEFTTDGGTEVYFNGVRQWIVAPVSSEMLIVRLTASQPLSGVVSVVTSGGSVNSNEPFVVLP